MTTKTRERSILLKPWEAKAFAEGRKTQVRRIVKFNHKPWLNPLSHVEYARDGMPIWFDAPPCDAIRASNYFDHGYPCPFGVLGDVLWGKEAFSRDHAAFYPHFPIIYAADGYDPRDKFESFQSLVYSPGSKRKYPFAWRPSIHMTRADSRTVRRIVRVWCERVQEMSEADAEAMGVAKHDGSVRIGETHRAQFAEQFNLDHGPGSWEANPWVFAAEVQPV